MAGYQLAEVTSQSLQRGIDQKSAPNNIPEGFSEDLVNVVVDSSGHVSKRPGYEGYYGYLPFRVTSIEHAGTTIYLTLDGSVNVANIVESPIVVYGKLSGAQSGDWSNTNNGEYYTTFDTGVRSTLTATSDTEVISGDTHGVETSNVALEIVRATNAGSLSNELFYPDTLKIANASTWDVSVTASMDADIEFFTLIADKDTDAGVSYAPADYQIVATSTSSSPGDIGTDILTDTAHGLRTGDLVRFTTSGTLPTGLSLATDYYVIRVDADSYKVATTRALALAGTAVGITATSGSGTHTATCYEGYIAITGVAHGLSNFNIIPYVYYLDGSDYVKLPFIDFTVNSTTGDVAIVVSDSAAAGLAIKVVLTAADSADAELITVAAESSDTIVVTTDEPFNFTALYATVGAVNTLVIPDSVVYDADAGTLTVTIYNSSLAAESFKFYWEPAVVRSSIISVTDNGAVSATYTDTAPQLTVWGLHHAEVYDSTSGEQGVVNHIDTYKTDGYSRVVAGLGGNIFAAYESSEVSASYLIPSAEVDLVGVVTSDVLVAPVFIDLTDDADRTHGNVAASTVESNKALITACSLVTAGSVKYTLDLTGLVGTLSGAISVTSGREDYLTVTGMSNDINNGTFRITAVSDGEGSITVANADASLSLYDETSAAGRGGIFTDYVTLTANSELLPGDIIDSTVFTGFQPEVVKSSAVYVTLSGITGRALVTAGTSLFPIRTTEVVPVSSTTGYVRGDMCSISTLSRKVRVLSVNNNTDNNISSITVASGIATVITAADHGLRTGNKVVLLRTGVAAYDQVVEVVSVANTSTFSFATTATDTVSSAGVVLGKTVHIDEELDIQDSAAAPMEIAVVGRWLPIEAPTSADSLPKTTYRSHFSANDYDAQAALRSAMAQDKLYLTDQDNAVMKFDGDYIQQAGLFRWQPQLFASVDTTTGSIALSGVEAIIRHIGGAGSPNRIGVEGASQFAVGDRVIGTNPTYPQIFTVESVDTVNDYVFTEERITESSTVPTDYYLRKVTRFKYAFRLNAIDAHDNIIASAHTGKDDFVVDLTADGQIHIRLVGMPVWGIYDYDRIELEIYRTKKYSEGPFYLVGVKDVSFAAGAGYIDFKDTASDEFLSTVDPVSVAVGLGINLGTGWTQPPRAKYITSIGNSIALAGLKDYPTFDISLRPNQGVGFLTASDLSGKKFTFKRDNTDAGTTTNMVDRVIYEFVTSGDVTIDPAADIATTATNFTVTEASHGLTAGDWVYFFHAAAGTNNNLDFMGWFQVASATTNTFTITFSEHTRGVGTGAATDVDRYVRATVANSTYRNVPVWLGTDGNLNQVGASTVNEFTAIYRLAGAINATMRMTNTAISGMTTFEPWLVAQAGDSIGRGRLVVRHEKSPTTTLSVVLPAAISTGSVFVGGIRRAASAEVDAEEQSHPSRVVLSYPNYPELFNSPFDTERNSNSESHASAVIDINPSDGQAITGIIPFFSESVFNQGAAEGVLAVFKTNSIYVVDIATGQKTKVQSNNMGTTAPHSIASTRDGIAFANESGVFKLTRELKVQPIGENLARIFKSQINKAQIAKMRGHHYGLGQQYKLSVPYGDATQLRNNHVLVYDYRLEGDNQPFGAWTRFTNHSATGWANLENDAFFATSDGQVFKIRNDATSQDYRDDSSAVAEMVILARANHFGAPGTRKVVRDVVSHFHMPISDMAGTELEVSRNLDGVFVSAKEFSIERGVGAKLKAIKSALPFRKMVYIQVRYSNSTKDESVVLAGIDYHAALLSSKGVQESDD